MRLAKVVLDAALSVDGVWAVELSKQFAGAVTVDGTPLPGVTVIALPGGRYELGLALVAEPVALHALADRVRERVIDSAGAAHLGEHLGPINVVFTDIVPAASRVT
ncbi:MAG: hypothetical protein ACTHQQ_09015 [Solirubrobacteraceae bacterium]